MTERTIFVKKVRWFIFLRHVFPFGILAIYSAVPIETYATRRRHREIIQEAVQDRWVLARFVPMIARMVQKGGTDVSGKHPLRPCRKIRICRARHHLQNNVEAGSQIDTVDF